MSARLRDRFAAFVSSEEEARPFFLLVGFFCALWAAYDTTDLLVRGTESDFFFDRPGSPTLVRLRSVQLALVALQTAAAVTALTRLRKLPWLLRGLLLAAAGLRYYQADALFRLNDFYFQALVLFLFAQYREGETPGRIAGWLRVVLRHQVAFVYFATALLKCNEHWLSGEHLWIRQQYLIHVLHWPYPPGLRWLMGLPSVNHVLAWAGVLGELVLAGMLVLDVPRRWCVALTVALHGFAALFLDVFFFGPSMVALVAYVGRPPRLAPTDTRMAGSATARGEEEP